MSKVVIGLSGGVDSSVAAWLLREQGHEVIALFMINWHETAGTLSGDCPWEDDRMFAELVARRLDLPFHVVDLSESYRGRVVDYMFAEYERGRTPNPDVLCNREVKFDLFMKAAFDLGAEYVATGHYCRREVVTGADGGEEYRLIAGVDGNKDQSYFLCQLSQRQLSRALFPIGDMDKPEVRRIAAQQKLATAQRKDSQGICFVGKVDLPLFLQQKLAKKPGAIIEIPPSWPGYAVRPDESDLAALAAPWVYSPQDGARVGEHSGAHFYTIGQRKGLGVGGKAQPLFVIGTDTISNIVYVGQGRDHPGLFRRALHIASGDVHWVRPSAAISAGENRFGGKPQATSKGYMARIRYRQPLQPAVLHLRPDGDAYLVFDMPQRGVTPGQFAAWYEGDELVGSGVIES
jgi:tRNA-specific 2-thiouridylase